MLPVSRAPTCSWPAARSSGATIRAPRSAISSRWRVSELLEVHEPDGAFARIDGWLTERGFFGSGSDGLVAELYLGYGLSEAIRRGTEQPPPEPCHPLPLAACRIGGDAGSGS